MTSDEKQIVGIDVGGANLKYATIEGLSYWTSFPLWRRPHDLAEVMTDHLAKLAASSQRIDSVAVTMTGELADCFVDRAAGVQHIVTHAQQAAASLGIPELEFYGVDGQFHGAEQAIGNPDRVAAANWHALASYVAMQIESDALLVDIGSTTTDLIPISDGRVATAAKTDFDRLVEGSLVYVGCRRTPVCALVDRLRFRGVTCRVMNEVFATIDDARIVLGDVAEDDADCDTADNAPRTRQDAANRLARMIGLDRRGVTLDDASELAKQIVDAACGRISDALQSLNQNYPCSSLVLSGHGQDLLNVPKECTKISLSDMLGGDVARCAPSYAIAQLTRSRAASSLCGG